LIFYLEPSIFSSAKQMSLWEQSILARRVDKLRDFPQYNREIYDQLRTVLPQDAQENSYVFLDGDAAISDATESVFSDNVHFGDRGYKLIAAHLFVKLREFMNQIGN
jgi:lysophospholipase L1-like esterase